MTRISAALCIVLLLAALPAHATRCRFEQDQRAESEQLFGSSERVFIGVLEALGPAFDRPRPPGPQEGGEDVLEPVTCCGPATVVVRFRIERSFKGGDTPAQVRINQDAARVGQRYLVYARREGAELRADGECRPTAVPPDASVAGWLQHLEQLPPEGSGGRVELYARRAFGQRALAHARLQFAGPAGPLELQADAEGNAEAVGVVAGRYRLQSPAPPGYRFECPRQPGCTGFEVQDRGRVQWAVVVEPLGRLAITLRDAQGRPVAVPARFELLDADSGQPVDWTSDFMHRPPAPLSASGLLPPGTVVVALQQIEVSREGLLDRVSARRRVFSGGAGSLAAAERLTIEPGANAYDFVLPAELQPVSIEVQLHGLLRPDSPRSFTLLTDSSGLWAQALPQHRSASRAAATDRFLALPGQYWEIAVDGHVLQDGGAHSWLLQARDHTALRLELRPAP